MIAFRRSMAWQCFQLSTFCVHTTKYRSHPKTFRKRPPLPLSARLSFSECRSAYEMPLKPSSALSIVFCVVSTSAVHTSTLFSSPARPKRTYSRIGSLRARVYVGSRTVRLNEVSRTLDFGFSNFLTSPAHRGPVFARSRAD